MRCAALGTVGTLKLILGFVPDLVVSGRPFAIVRGPMLLPVRGLNDDRGDEKVPFTELSCPFNAAPLAARKRIPLDVKEALRPDSKPRRSPLV